MGTLRLPNLSSLSDQLRVNLSGGSPQDVEAAPAVDLLRERRLASGQQTIRPLLIDRRRLILRSLLIGTGVLSVALAVSGLVFLRLQLIRSQINQYAPVESQAADLRAQLGQIKARINEIQQRNDAMKGQITNIRPTSAVMSALQRHIPAGIQLDSITAGDANLQLVGKSEEPLAFARINALQLELRRSPLLDPSTITLSRLDRVTDTGTSSLPAVVKFTISAGFSQLPPDQKQQLLARLGSLGMAKRLELLQKEGLLP